ncbi:hypothetical protein [Roseovarius aestuarii]|uniref:Uncharacterized protein n=1 Tax=Roseovarius aestuarii TaxID=475083 RepID=A0A1X7BMZ7_9RHOB|nr:hypothetical protein [Roseovarius aestuarii]SMC10971.1 hypothetical protein ROA7745_00780 [Roseovarius aestuarii]
MWLKKKSASSAEIPKLRDEYQRLLHETLPDVGSLHETAKPARPCNLSRVAAPVDETVWQEHQRALQHHQKKAEPPTKSTAGLTGGDDILLAQASFAN